MESWGNRWMKAADLLRRIADDCSLKKKKTTDREPNDMLVATRTVPWEERKARYKRIWRRRRHLEREKHLTDLQQAATAGRAPAGPRPSVHLNWGEIVGSSGVLPKTLLTNHFAELYGLPKEEAESVEKKGAHEPRGPMVLPTDRHAEHALRRQLLRQGPSEVEARQEQPRRRDRGDATSFAASAKGIACLRHRAPLRALGFPGRLDGEHGGHGAEGGGGQPTSAGSGP